MIRVLDPQRLPPGRVLAASTALLTVGAVLAGLLLADVRLPPFQALDESWAGWITSLRSPFWDGLNVFLNLAGYRGVLVLHGLLVAALLLETPAGGPLRRCRRHRRPDLHADPQGGHFP